MAGTINWVLTHQYLVHFSKFLLNQFSYEQHSADEFNLDNLVTAHQTPSLVTNSYF